MAITNIEKKDKKEELKEKEQLKLQSDAIAKLYKKKQQISNEKNVKR